MSRKTPIIEFKNVSLVFDSKQIFNEFNFNIYEKLFDEQVTKVLLAELSSLNGPQFTS